MVAWKRSRKADTGLRLLGVVLCAVAYASISHLIALRPTASLAAAGPLAYALAAIGFLSASAGGALTLLGDHLFDEVQVSDR